MSRSIELIILESDEKLIELLQKLRPSQYKVFSLYYGGTCPSYKQIAFHLGIPLGTVKSRLARARTFLLEHREARKVELVEA